MDVAWRWLESAASAAGLDPAALIVTAVCVGTSALMLYSRHQAAKDHLPLPPGPRGLPLIGNLFDVPLGCSWIKLSQWARKYGDVVHINIFGQHIIFLNSVRVANELLEKRSSIYSDRPHLPLLNELMGLGWNFGLMQYGNEWRQHRRMLSNKFGPSAVQIFNPAQEFVSCLLVERLLENPPNLDPHCKLHASQSILMSLYGVLIDSPEHDFVTNAEAVMNAVGDVLRPGGVLIDALPFLKHIPAWFPGANYQRAAKQWKIYVKKLKDDPYRVSRERFMDGKTSFPSYVGEFLSTIDGDGVGDKEHIISGTAAVAYGAGSDTSYSAISAFFLAMIINPEAQRKAQKELDTVVGTSRLPSLNDSKALPYITALARETLRWHSVAPQSVPHSLREEDTYNGYRLPKKSIIVANTWWMAHDPEIYSEPEVFKPERFFNAKGELDLSNDPAKYAFGFGRRICPGLHYAQASLFIGIATVLATLNIEPARDADGEPIKAVLDPSPGVLSHPRPYACKITPRSEQAVSLIRQAIANAPF